MTSHAERIVRFIRVQGGFPDRAGNKKRFQVVRSLVCLHSVSW